MNDDTNAAQTVRFKGTPIAFGDRTLIVPPLSLRSVMKLQDALDKLAGTPDLQAVVTLAHEALRRNYPDITHDELVDVLDLNNMQSVVVAMMGGNAAPAPVAAA